MMYVISVLCIKTNILVANLYPIYVGHLKFINQSFGKVQLMISAKRYKQ